jgi:hypothetical protein
VNRDGDPFDALVAAAADDADAALALAATYARAPRPARVSLLDAIRAGAAAEGVSPIGPLAALLAVEVDLEVAAQIRDALFTSQPHMGLAPETTPTALMTGDLEDGAVILSRPLYGPFVDVVAVVWERGRVIRTRIEPLLRHDAIEEVSTALPDASLLAVTDYHRAQRRLTEVLWRHLRDAGGALPASLAAHV